jgi:glyoxylase-like metal-dependent hydrolase (beta-lactamase superfamily II)
MIIETFTVGMLQCNCTILGDEQTREAIVIDPGDDPDVILSRLQKHQLTLKQIVCTHTHIDHVGAIHELQEKSGTSASIHKADLLLLDKLDVQAQWIGMHTPERGTVDHYLSDGEAVTVKGIELGVIHTPGHTPGSTTFVLGTDQKILFTGDTLFQRSIGRTDLWGGSYPQIITSIKDRLMTFEDETIVISGHGASTTIGLERRHNPFLR